MQIKELILYSSNIALQKKFYTEVLQLPMKESNANSFTVSIGQSILKFEFQEDASPYHFAINIPSNQEYAALLWLKQRVDLLTDGKDELVDFVSWNAKSMYFYDEDRNILELIARKNLNIYSDTPFDSSSFLEISEIGLATENIEKQFLMLESEIGLSVYDGNFEKFCAIGNEYGLFICVNSVSKNWFPTQDAVYRSPFVAVIKEKETIYKIDYRQDILTIKPSPYKR